MKNITKVLTWSSSLGSGWVSTITGRSWLDWTPSCKLSDGGSIIKVDGLPSVGSALVSDVLGLCSITATKLSSSNALKCAIIKTATKLLYSVNAMLTGALYNLLVLSKRLTCYHMSFPLQDVPHVCKAHKFPSTLWEKQIILHFSMHLNMVNTGCE